MKHRQPTNPNSFTLKELAELTKSELVGDPKHTILNVASLESAGPEDISFLANPKHQPVRYLQAMRDSGAGAVFISPDVQQEEGKNYLVHSDPSQAFQTILEKFYDDPEIYTGFSDIHPSAVIHESAKIGENINIGPNAVIEKEVQIGNGSTVGAGTYIGPKSCIGENCIIHPNVTIREQVLIGNRVIIQPGVVIGSCGFGYATDQRGKHSKLKQLGTVSIEDDVEIGANTTIDRARFTETRIGSGTKIDNLVQIAHGVEVGSNCFIIGQTGIAGSTKIGNHVILAGQVAVNGHIEICDQVMVAAKSGISKSIHKPGKYGGVPAVPIHEYNRTMVHLRNIGKIIKELKGQ